MRSAKCDLGEDQQRVKREESRESRERREETGEERRENKKERREKREERRGKSAQSLTRSLAQSLYRKGLALQTQDETG